MLPTAAARSAVGSMPMIRTLPPVRPSNPIQLRMSVDLPAPFGPTNAVMVPGAIARLTSRSAQEPPRR